MIDAAQLVEFAARPSAKGINVQHMQFLRPDGIEFGFAQRHSKGFASKLRRYTGMDDAQDRHIDIRSDGDADVELRVICQRGNTSTGSTSVLERPIGTRIGAIRKGQERYVFELADGERIGSVDLAEEESGSLTIVDGSGQQIGTVDLSLPETPSFMDLVVNSPSSGDLGVQGWQSKYKGVYLKLDAVPAEPLRTFILALPVALTLGFRRSGDWDKPEEPA